MKRIVFASLIVTSSFTTVLLSSCKKEHIDSETQSSSDYSICEGEFTKLTGLVIGHSRITPGVKKINSINPVVILPDTVAHPGWPRIVVINYDSVAVDSSDGKIRRGRLICEYSNYWRKAGARIKITLKDYVVNGGTLTVDSIILINKMDGLTEMNVYNGKYTNQGWSLEWACNRSFTQLAGVKTPVFEDDVFRFSGNATAKTRAGKKITCIITTPLTKHVSCKWIDAGKIDLTLEGSGTRTIDFGNGTCDNTAKLTVNGNTLDFTLD